MKVVRQTLSETHSSNLFFPWFSTNILKFSKWHFVLWSLLHLRNFFIGLVEYTMFNSVFVRTFLQSFQMSVFLVVNFIKLCKTLGGSSKRFDFVFDKSWFEFCVTWIKLKIWLYVLAHTIVGPLAILSFSLISLTITHSFWKF